MMDESLLENISVGDVYEDGKGHLGVLKFGLYEDGEGAYDEYHFGYYIEYESKIRYGTAINKIALPTALYFEGFRKS